MKTKKTNDILYKLNMICILLLLVMLVVLPTSNAQQIHIDGQNQVQTQQSDNLDTTQDPPRNTQQQQQQIRIPENIISTNTNNTARNQNTNTVEQPQNRTRPIVTVNPVEVESPVTNQFPETEDPLGIHADSCILVEANSGKILYEKNASQKTFPASTTKLMTAILTTEYVNDLNEKATVSYYAVKSIPATYSIANLQPGEQVSINDLLNSLLVGSANDSAYVLAQYIMNHGNNYPYDDSRTAEENFNNSINQFSELMNRRAKELGCKNTKFLNPNGIHNNFHYSTAVDLAIIGQTAYKNQTIREIATKLEYTIQDSSVYRPTERTMKQTNSLLYSDRNAYYEYANGLKTGYTEAAEYCIVASSSKDGFDLIAVVLHSDNISDDNISREADCKKLFEYGYNTYQITNIIQKDTIITTLKVKNGNKELQELNLLSDKDITAVLKNKEIYNFAPQIELTKKTAPIRKGEIIGTATYTIDDTDYKVDLIAEHAVSVNSYSTYIFIAIGVFLIIAVIAIILTSVLLKDDY